MERQQAPTDSTTRADALIAVAGGGTSIRSDEVLSAAVKAVAQSCGPNSIDALVTLLRRLNAAAPRRIAAYPVVAFVRYGHRDGSAAGRGVAITSDGDQYNVHTVSWDESAARWEGGNGRYGVTWDAARIEMNRRADGEPQP